jgi:hypothetical protein
VFRRGFVWWVLVAALLGAAGYVLWQFPGQQLGMAWTLGTGRGIEALQARADAIERQILHRKPVSREDQRFLVDLYSAMATGGRHLPPIRQSGRLMQHYLKGNGQPFEVPSSLFLGSSVVVKQAAKLRQQARRRAAIVRAAKVGLDGYQWSPQFYMASSSSPDSFFGLYWGRLGYRARIEGSGKRLHLHWRTEVDWRWPRYAELRRKYGKARAEVVPIPNVRMVVYGKQYALQLSNGLGGYLEEAGLARSFLAYAEWDEVVPLPAIR